MSSDQHPLHVLDANVQRLASFQEKRARTRARQQKPGEQSGRASADDDRPPRKSHRAFGKRVRRVDNRRHMGTILSEDNPLLRHRHVHGINQINLPGMPGVHPLAVDLKGEEVGEVNSQGGTGGPPEVFVRVSDRESKLFYSKHLMYRRITGHEPRRPGPLEVVATAVAIHIDNFPRQIKAGDDF